jgi:hypothetical protein
MFHQTLDTITFTCFKVTQQVQIMLADDEVRASKHVAAVE